jgi:hypothetical protein
MDSKGCLVWAAGLLVIVAVILAVGFGSGAWPFTQFPPGRLSTR